MEYLDYFYTKDEIEDIEKKDNLYVEGVISLDDEENQGLLDSYVFQLYLRKQSAENFDNNKGGEADE